MSEDILPDIQPDHVTEQFILPGEKLRQARESQKRSVEQMAERMKLEPSVIVALEDSDFGHLPAPIFVVGYLRNYSRLLNIPSDPLVEAYQLLVVDREPVLAESKREVAFQSAWKVPMLLKNKVLWHLMFYVFIIILVVWLVLFLRDRYLPSPTESMIDGLSTDVSLDKPILNQDEMMTEVPTTNQPPVDAVATPIINENISVQLRETWLTPMIPGNDDGGLKTVVINFDADSWFEISDSLGLKKTNDLGRQHQVRVFHGLPPFSILIGFAEGVKIEYEGELIDLASSTRKNVARLTIGGRDQ